MGLQWIVGGFLLLSGLAASAEDSQALTDFKNAIARQRASPAYVESVYQNLPKFPGLGDTIQDEVKARLKEQLVEKIDEKTARVTAYVPQAGAAVQRAADRIDVPPTELVPIEREVERIEYAGGRERHVLTDGLGEMIRTSDKTAWRFHVSQQVAAMQLAVAAGTAVAAVQSARSARQSVDDISRSLASGNVVGAALDVLAALSQLSQTLGNVRTTAELVKATAALEKFSNVWVCQLTPAPPNNFRIVSVDQLADDSLDGVPTHIFLAHRMFGRVRHADAPAPEGGDAPPTPEILNRVWVRVTDGLPVRSDIEFPGGQTRRALISYPDALDIPAPPCPADS